MKRVLIITSPGREPSFEDMLRDQDIPDTKITVHDYKDARYFDIFMREAQPDVVVFDGNLSKTTLENMYIEVVQIIYKYSVSTKIYLLQHNTPLQGFIPVSAFSEIEL